MARHLSSDEAEGLFSGRAPDDRPDLAILAEAIAGLRSALVVEPPAELRDRQVAAAVAAVLDAPEPAPVRVPSPARSRLGLGRAIPGLAAKVLVGTSLALALGTGAAAAGILPAPIQEAFADVVSIVGIDLPRPTTTTTAVTTIPPDDSTTTTNTSLADPSTTTAVPLPPLTAVLAVAADPQAVDEPGGPVTFTVTVTNTTSRSAELVALSDETFGDLLDPDNPALIATTCSPDGVTLAAGEEYSCTFEAEVTGAGGDPDYSVTAVATLADAAGFETTVTASTVVAFNDVDPIVALQVAPAVTSVPEPGGDVPVTVTLVNRSQETVTLTSLTDDGFGNLLDPDNPLLAENTCAVLSRGFDAGVTKTCGFTAAVAADAASSPGRHATRAVVVDGQSNSASVSQVFSLTYEDVLPTVTVSVTPSAIVLPEPGGTVTYSVAISNGSVEPIDLWLLIDTAFGNLLVDTNVGVAANTCPGLAGAHIAVGGSVTCTFQADLAGGAGDQAHSNAVVVRAFDNELNPATGTATAQVGFTAPGTTVAGEVFADLDGDGIRGTAEGGIPGVRLAVTIPGIGSRSVTTGADGSWSALVTPGPVTVTVTSGPLGLQLTTGNATQALTAVSGVGVVVEPIGYQPLTETIEGSLYVDFDGDQVRDGGEPGIPGVTVELTTASGAVIGTRVTGPGGSFVFNPEDPGTYVVRVVAATLPAESGLFASSEGDGTADGRITVTVGAGETVSGLAFGHRGGVTIDQRNLAVAPGTKVRLTWAGFDGVFATGDDLTLVTTADAAGAYSFTGLPKGQYSLVAG